MDKGRKPESLSSRKRSAPPPAPPKAKEPPKEDPSARFERQKSRKTMLASRVDDDFHAYQPYFWPFDDNFDDGATTFSLDVTFPDEDIWKKFELLPTPPRSPSRLQHLQTFIPSIDDKLRLVKNTESPTSGAEADLASGTTGITSIEIHRALIRDCMWGGSSLPDSSKTIAISRTKPMGSVLSSSTQSSIVEGEKMMDCERVAEQVKESEVFSSYDCVSPSSVLPCRPLVDHSHYAAPVPLKSAMPVAVAPTPTPTPVSAPTPPSSASESDEEIDVVTVAASAHNHQQQHNARHHHHHRSKKRPIVRTAYPAPSHVGQQQQQQRSTASMTPPTPSEPKSATVKIESYPTVPPSAKRPRISSAPASPSGVARRATTTSRSVGSGQQRRHSYSHHHCNYHHKNNRRTSTASSASSSSSRLLLDESDDNEVDFKRNTHNVLERKRRNDLKSSFHHLRLHVPDICDNEKTPKVVILKKAVDYVWQARNDEERLRLLLEMEKRRNESLLMRLTALESR